MGRTTNAMARFASALVAMQSGTEDSGSYAFKKGYHSSRRDNLNNWPGNYSTRYVLDLWGPEDVSAAHDWTFHDAQNGHYATIAEYSSRLLAAKDDPRMIGWREFYGQTDGDTAVEGWDWYLQSPVTSDSSHLWHIHLSEHRMWAESWLNKLAALSVLRGESLAAFVARMAWPAWSDVVEPMRQGARGFAVYLVQCTVGAVADGDFGPATAGAVRFWQSSVGLVTDAVIGPESWSWLGATQHFMINGGSTMTQLTGPDPWDPTSGANAQAAQLRDAHAAIVDGYQPPGSPDSGVIARLDRIERMLLAAGGDPSAAPVMASLARIEDALKAGAQATSSAL